ncbi:adenylate/guanylate cyclase domain-containing protein [Rhodospirillaceae bacterium KN72]|uniref:Adenylate/guanylate cyclase domain-containing protein n=1 Tax=Pacificispira spongiicola TaxID=2729598 RepID=A0A7Y0DZ01_9PROT|nr:adenylate/guanylate cyclase domain-containing protein [Pacificispira spongiicola]NMM44160.1 adenylate/guanylate cyclase domain-containing protein [Pacificispira spongiicola]
MSDTGDAGKQGRITGFLKSMFGGKKKRRGPWWKPGLPTIIAFAVLVSGIAVRIVDPAPVEMLRLRTFDYYNVLAPRVPPPQSQVVIVDIDEKTLAELGQWPWPRTIVAELLDALRDYGVAVVGFDVVFAEPDKTSPGRMAMTRKDLPPELRSALEGISSNEEIMAASMRTVRTVLGQAGTKTQSVLADSEIAKFTAFKGALGLLGVQDPNKAVDERIYKMPSLIYNLPEIESSASGLASISVEEEVDGVVRRVPMIMEIGGVIKPTLSIEMLRVGLQGNSIFAAVDPGGIHEIRLQTPRGNFPIPTDANGRIWVYYAKPDIFNSPTNEGRMYISASDIIAKRVPPERLKGRLAVVGTSSVGLVDIRATPIEPRLPGVEVHANVIENILSQQFIRYPDTMRLTELIAMAVVGLLLIFFIPRVGPVVTLVGLVVGGGGFAAASWYLFSTERILLDTTYPGGLLFSLYAVLAFANYARDAAEKRQVRGAFSQYLSPDLVEQLAEDPDKLQLGGETKKMTLLFCDVRGFTTISESFKSDPQGLTVLINRLLTPLTGEILKRRGTIDKYMGDCIMAFWNAPLDVPEQEAKACESALAMFESLEALNEDRKREALEEGKPFLPLNIGIGLNTGDCVVGNMGSEQRFDYSVLGDAVNLASRLEGQSKSYGVGIVIGEETARAVTGRFPLAELDLIAVKGKSEAVRIFTIMGKPDMLQDPDYDNFERQHASMLEAYRAQNWEEAERLMATLKGRLNGVLDGFYDIYGARVAEYRENPPPAEWDGVYVATSK